MSSHTAFVIFLTISLNHLSCDINSLHLYNINTIALNFLERQLDVSVCIHEELEKLSVTHPYVPKWMRNVRYQALLVKELRIKKN